MPSAPVTAEREPWIGPVIVTVAPGNGMPASLTVPLIVDPAAFGSATVDTTFVLCDEHPATNRMKKNAAIRFLMQRWMRGLATSNR
jgi:hypothetical protein